MRTKSSKLALRVLSTATFLAMVSSCATAAFAGTYDLTNGSVTVNAKSTGTYVTQKDADGNFVKNGEVELNNYKDETPVTLTSNGTETSNTITIHAEDGEANVTLKDVDIVTNGEANKSGITVKADKTKTATATVNVTLDNVTVDAREDTSSEGATGGAGMTIQGNGVVNIELDGKNELLAGDGHAGLEKNRTESVGSLNINDSNEDGGSLTAIGGDGGAGIGGSSKTSDGKDNDGYTTSTTWGGNVVINGGTITAEGGTGAAGIGSGSNATDTKLAECSQFVKIVGGTVTATGGEGGAGIGGGKGDMGSGLYILNGTVNAYGKGGGAGIGGGDGAGAHMVGLNAGVSGVNDAYEPTVTAVGSEGAAGIGGGKGGRLTDAVLSSGTATAIGGVGGAGIGNGEGASGGNIYVSGGEIYAEGGAGAEAFGSGKDNTGTVAVRFFNPNQGGGVAADSEDVSQSFDLDTKTLTVSYKKDGETIGSIHYTGTLKEMLVEPTCTTDGRAIYTATYYKVTDAQGNCTKETFEGEVVLPATGHNWGEWTTVKEATATETGLRQRVCSNCNEVEQEEIPVLPTTALELNVLAPDGSQQAFHVTQSGTVRTYESPYDSGTLTGTMETLEYLQAHGAQTIVFTTSQRTSSFQISDLLALADEGDVFYLTHAEVNEPTLLVVTSDHTDLLEG